MAQYGRHCHNKSSIYLYYFAFTGFIYGYKCLLAPIIESTGQYPLLNQQFAECFITG
jgi:hypothetical protein